MTDPAIVSAIISGAVALAALSSSAVFGAVSLRHQRKLEAARQLHDQSLRLLDSALKAAVDFLAAADRTTRAQQGLSTAYISLDNAKSSRDEQVYQSTGRYSRIPARQPALPLPPRTPTPPSGY